MCRFRPRLAAVAALLVSWSISPAPIRAQETPPATDDGAAPRKVTLRGNVYDEYPADKLRQRGIRVPDVPDDRNAALIYIDAYNARVDLPSDLQDAFDQATAGAWPQDESGRRLAEWLEQNRPALDLARRAAAMPDCRMPVFGGDYEMLFALLLPTMSEHRQIARMLAIEATYRQSTGDAAGAVDSVLTLQRMANHVAGGTFIIEHLVGNAICDLTAQTLQRLSADESLDDAVVRRALAESESLAAEFPDWEISVANEQAMMLDTVQRLMENPAMLPYFASGGFSMPADSGVDEGWRRLGRRLARLHMPDRTVKRQLTSHFEAIRTAAQPAAPGRPAAYGLDDEAFREAIPVWNVVAQVLMPSLSRSFELDVRSRSNLERARINVAAAAYRRKHGAAPRRIDELVPAYVKSIPLDPASGSPLALSSGDVAVPMLDRDFRIARPSSSKKAAARVPVRTPPPAADGIAPPSSQWRQYVEEFVERYGLDAAQRKTAFGVLEQMERRAASFEQVHGARLTELRSRLARAARDADRKTIGEELNSLAAPLNAMFEELKQRLETLPTEKQRKRAQP